MTIKLNYEFYICNEINYKGFNKMLTNLQKAFPDFDNTLLFTKVLQKLRLLGFKDFSDKNEELPCIWLRNANDTKISIYINHDNLHILKSGGKIKYIDLDGNLRYGGILIKMIDTRLDFLDYEQDEE